MANQLLLLVCWCSWCVSALCSLSVPMRILLILALWYLISPLCMVVLDLLLASALGAYLSIFSSWELLGTCFSSRRAPGKLPGAYSGKLLGSLLGDFSGELPGNALGLLDALG